MNSELRMASQRTLCYTLWQTLWRSPSVSLIALCAMVLTSLPARPSGGASSAQSIIESRQDGFKDMGAAMKALKDQLKSSTPDAATLVAAAKSIEAGAEALPGWFPAGSGAQDGIETDALDYIWENREKFDALTRQLLTESKNLTAATSSSDGSAIRERMKAVGEVCSSCHRSFRAD